MTGGLFVGRSDELARFAVLLGDLPVDGRRRRWPRGRKSRADRPEATKSRVVLVHGLGGSGKSRLLRQFQAMADGSLPNLPVTHTQVRTVWLDWEDEQRDQPASYAGADGPSLVTVLDAVQHAVIEAVGGDTRAAEHAGQAFGDYRQGAARMPQYAVRFADVIAQSSQAGSLFTTADAATLAKSAMSIGLAVGGHPAGVLGLTPDQVAASTQAAAHLSEAATKAVTGKKAGEISAEEYDLVADPVRELTRRVANALRNVASTVPLVVFLDTGEVIGSRAWAWLRRVMTHTGPRVIWVAGARLETEAEAGVDSPVAQFVRDIGDAHLMLMSPTRFDDLMISEYLASRPGGRSYTGAQIDMIAQFTRGLPLAVSFTGELLEQGQDVEDVCRELDDGLPSSVVYRLARRYLVHAEQRNYPDRDPRRDDLAKILGLALAFGDLRTDPDLLAALWDIAVPLAAFQDLARRHDFVLPVSRRLHEDVREALRADLLDPYRRAGVREINQRALDLYGSRLRQMRSRWLTLDQQLDHKEFTTALLAALWHMLWVDNQAGLDFFTAILPVLVVADLATADAAAGMMVEFAGTFDQEQRRDLDRLTAVDPRRVNGDWRRIRTPLPDYILNVSDSAADPLIGDLGDLRIAVLIMRAHESVRRHDFDGASNTLLAAAAQTSSSRLRKAIRDEGWGMHSRLRHPSFALAPSASRQKAAAAKVIAEASENDPGAWTYLSVTLLAAGHFDDALAAIDRALALGPNDPDSHNFRGFLLTALQRFGDALLACDRAIALDPDLPYVHLNRGIVLTAMGELDEALAELDTANELAGTHKGEAEAWAGAILWHRRDSAGARDRFARVEGRVTGCTPFCEAEMEAVALCGLGQADGAEKRLLNALRWRIPGETCPRALYDLLSDPALPGIDRLRLIVDGES